MSSDNRIYIFNVTKTSEKSSMMPYRAMCSADSMLGPEFEDSYVRVFLSFQKPPPDLSNCAILFMLGDRPNQCFIRATTQLKDIPFPDGKRREINVLIIDDFIF